MVWANQNKYAWRMRVDTHVHFWEYDQQRDDWMDSMPVLQQNYLLCQILMAGLWVAHLWMPKNFYQFVEHSLVDEITNLLMEKSYGVA